MKRVLYIFLLFSHICKAQDLQSFLSTSSFYSKEGAYLETSLSFSANTLALKKIGDVYSGNIDVNISIFQDTNLVFSDHYILNSPNFDSMYDNNIFFFDQKRILLEDGAYLLQIELFDLLVGKKYLHEENITINYNDYKVSLSDIQFIDYYTDAKEENILNKSGYYLSPFVSNFYPKEIDTLIYYFETYNTHLLKDKRYMLKSYVEVFDSYSPLFDFNKKIRKQSSTIESNILMFNITSLPTGNYNLVTEIRDINNQLIDTKKIFFQRSNHLNSYSKIEDLSILSINGTFVEDISNQDSMRIFIDFLYPIASTQENTFLENQLKYDNINLMQKFFFNFWKERNPLNPEDAWYNYYKEVKKVNKEFKNMHVEGYLTDRGRVYLQYGPPNSRNQVKNASATYPYEIWHYYKIKRQSNKKFVFVNSDLATNEYRLEYSNVYGEVTNSEWRDRIEQDQNPTFGDDFNNNYINPR
mgnify:CR=1 FL=1